MRYTIKRAKQKPIFVRALGYAFMLSLGVVVFASAVGR